MKKKEMSVIVLAVLIIGVFSFSLLYVQEKGITGFAVYNQGSQSDFDEGNYNNTEYNGSVVALKYWKDSEQELLNNKEGDLMSGNVLLMHMNDETIGSNPVQDSAGSNDGIPYGDAQITTSGKLNNAGLFDGDGDYMKIDNSELSGLDIVDEYTIEVWVNAGGHNSAKIVQKGDWDGHAIYQDEWDGWKTTFRIEGSSYSIDWGEGQPTLNQWYHLIGIYNGSAISLYVDGVEKNSLSVSGNLSTNTRPLIIGAADGQKYFDGKTDEVAIYNKALSEAEISTLYNSGNGQELNGNEDGLVSVWHMNENAWRNNVEDTSGEGNNGIYNGALYSQSGKLNSAIGFDGSDDFVDLGTGISFELANPFTVSTWIYSDLDSTSRDIIADLDTSIRGWEMRILDTNKVRFVVCGSGANYIFSDSVSALTSGWHHVVGTWDGSTTKIYLDSVGYIQSGSAGTLTTISNSVPVSIGYSEWTGSNNFKGSIDEVAIWDRSLSGDEVSEIYQRQKAKYGGGKSGIYTSKIFNANNEVSWNNLSWGGDGCYDCYGDMTFYADYNTDIDGTWAKGGLTGTATGGATISGGKLDLAYNDKRYIAYDAVDNADSQQTGCIRFKVTPNYSGAPSSAQCFFAISHTSDYNTIQFYHWSDATTYILIKGNTGINIVFGGLGVWNPTAGQEYEIEVNYDITNGATRVFINGTQLGPTQTGTGTRDSNIVNFRVGTSFNTAYNSNFKIDDFTVFDKVQHTSDYNAPSILAPCLNLSARTCDDNACSGETWTDITDSSPQNLSLTNNQYFQYKFLFETDDSSYSPELESMTIDYTILNSVPTITLISPQDGATYGYNESLALNFVAFDNDNNNDSCWYNLDGGNNIILSDCANTTFDVVGNGNYNLNIYINDTYGEQANDSVSFNIQLGAPTIILNSPISTYLNYQENIQFVYTPTDIDLDSCELWGDFDGSFKLNQTNTNPTNGSENTFTLDLNDGVYLWNIKCNDSQGNSAFNGNKTFGVDSVNPEVSITSPTGQETSRTGISLVFSASDDNLDSCWYNVYRGSVLEVINTSINCSDSATFDVTINADFILNLYANDSAGNLNSANSSFSVDTSSSPPPADDDTNYNPGGSGAYVTSPKKSELEIKDIGSIIIYPGEEKTIEFSVKNIGKTSVNKCKLQTTAEYKNWIESNEMKNIAPGEIKEFKFVLRIPDSIESNLNPKIKLMCIEDNVSLPLNIILIKPVLNVNISQIDIERKNKISVKYELESDTNSKITLVFSVYDFEENKISEKSQEIEIKKGEKLEKEILLDVSNAEQGLLKIVVAKSGSKRPLLEDSIFYNPSVISGWSIKEIFGSDKFYGGVIIIVFLSLATFIIIKIFKPKQTGSKN